MSRHRATKVRPRYGRLGAVMASLCVTLVAVLGGFGVLPLSPGQATAPDEPPARQRADAQAPPPPQMTAEDATTSVVEKDAKGTGVGRSADATERTSGPREDIALPEGSGEGRRVVYSEGRQRVWLVNEDGSVARTYPVSGSIYDNLDPGAYNVYSRSEDAWGVDDSGSMKYFVRFTQGDTGAAIGFHDIPVSNGQPAQSESQLGTPTSHGCIRQRRSDAIALWEFAPLGTSVIVTA